MTTPIPKKTQAYFSLFLIGFVSYAPVLKTGFLWDDHVLIESNPYIRSWSLTNLKHDFSSTVSNGYGDAGYLRPVVTWSNRMDYGLWALHPFGYHLTSLCLHVANAMLLYEFLLVLACTPMTALLTAILFVVHPIGVEGLLAVTGRATFLSFFFGMITLLFLAEPTPERFLLGALGFALALFSKEQSVVLPFYVILVWLVRRVPLKRFLYVLPLFAILGGYLTYRRHLFGTVGVPPDYAFTLRFFIQVYPRVMTHYIRLILIPWNLHSHRLILRMSHTWTLSLAFWMGLAIWSFYKRAVYPRTFFCVYWLAIGLLPSAIAMVHGGFMLDHWGYWLAPAVLLPLGILFDALWMGRQKRSYERWAMLYFVVVIGYAMLVRLNIELRNTDEKMYRWALHFTTSHPIKYNLGILLLQSGRATEAIPYFEDVRTYYPEDLNNLHAMALAYWFTGHPKLAIRLLQDALKIDPSFLPAIQSLQRMRSSKAPLFSLRSDQGID
jgi:tetratricopeptide (TPR) repeat protein